jgi:tetratricopeptide (TPR) repeat protein
MASIPMRWRRRAAAAAAAALIAPAWAVTPASLAKKPKEPVHNSAMDASLFYQMLVGELELRTGAPGDAYLTLLDAARRSGDEGLFRRAVQIALQARAGDQALSAVQAWRTALPHSTEALRYQVELLIVLNRPSEAMQPMAELLQASPPKERPGMIASIPRYLARATDHKAVATQAETLLKPYTEQADTRTAARIAMARLWLLADDTARSTALLELARKDDPSAPGPALLALEMMGKVPASEQTVIDYLQQPKAEPAVRLAYVRVLTGTQRYADAARQLEQITREQPQLPQPWLTMGALQLEMKHPADAEAALQRYLALTQPKPPVPSPSASAASAPASPATEPAADDDDDDDEAPANPATSLSDRASEQGRTSAYLMLAQAAEMREDYKAAEAWLAKIDNPARALEVQTRRASLLARQGKVNEARELIRKVPERSPEDARAKLLAEAQMLRDTKHWAEAQQALAEANKRYPDDADLLYDEAMLDERLGRLDEMEKLLRKVIALKPDNQNAYNALGYSLADHNQRLPEAKALIEKALQLAPGEPFITDSLGWVQFKLGNLSEATKLLQQAYRARPDAEIAAHLGEVLWSEGQKDEARKLLREAKQRDPSNEALNEVIDRLKVGP